MALKQGCCAHGYEISQCVRKWELTDADIEPGAIYRTLRRLEREGYVVSTWDTRGPGPARRHYILTPAGEERLERWVEVLRKRREALESFIRDYQALVSKPE